MDPTRLVRSFTASRPAAPAGQVGSGTYDWWRLPTSTPPSSAPASPAATSPDAARWARYCGPSGGWVHWADLALADAWLAEAVRRTSAATETQLRNGGWDAQRNGTIAAWQALAAAFRALNLPPLSSPDYGAALQRYYGAPRNRDAADAQAQVVRAMSVDTSAGPLPGPVGADLARVYRVARGIDLGPTHPVHEILVRLSLTSPDAELQQLCTFGAVGEGPCDFSPGLARWNGCGDGAHGMPDCRPYDWNTWAWHDPPAAPFAAGEGDQVERALPAMWWSFALARDLATTLAGLGAAAVLARGRTYQTLRNLAIAKAGHQTPEELTRIADQVPADLSAARFNNVNMKAASATVAAVGAAVAAIPGGQVYGALIAGVGALVGLLPSAVGYPTDPWGRAAPALERGMIAGDAETAPAYAVAGPPGYVPPAHPAASNCAPPGTTASTGGGVPTVAVAAGVGGLALLAWWLLA